jgi:hypothetical protein
MPAPLHDLNVDQGATFKRRVIWRNEDSSAVDVTGYTARMQVRTGPEVSSYVLNLKDDAGITVGTTDGSFLLEATATKMQSVPAGSLWYDLEVISPTGIVTRLLRGRFNVSREITR